MPDQPRVVLLKPLITSPLIEVGEFSYYDDPDDPTAFETRNVLYHYGPEKLIIGKFCALGEGVRFIMNGANHRMDGPSTFPFPIMGGSWAEHFDLIAKPSKAAQRRIRERLRTELRSLRGSNAQAVIRKLNPIIRGWAAYYRTQVSSEVFDALDHHLWRLTWTWARYSHQNKPKSWVFATYYGKFNKSRQDRWVFGDRKSGAYLQSSPGPGSSDTSSSTVERPPTTPRSPSTGPGDDNRRRCRSTRPPRGSSTPRTVAARSAAER